MSRPFGNARQRAHDRVRVRRRGGQHRALDEVVGRSADRRGVDRAFVRERVEERPVGVDQRHAVGSAVLRVDLDDQVRTRGEGAGERPAQVLVPGAAVDEHERDAREVGRGVAGVVDLDEAAGVGADLVVVDLVDHELGGPGRRRRWRASVLARQHDRAVDLRLDGDRALRRRARRAGDPVQRLDRRDRSARTGRPCRSRRPGRACRPGLAARPGVALAPAGPGAPSLPSVPAGPAGPAGPCTFQLSACSERLHGFPAEGIEQDAGLVPAGLDHAVVDGRVEPRRRTRASDRECERDHAERDGAHCQPSNPSRHRSSS